MRIVLFRLVLAATSVPFGTIAAQGSVVGHPGEAVRVTAAVPTADSLMQGRLAWISADSLSVWRRDSWRTIPIGSLRSVEVQRRPLGYGKRTIVAAVALGTAGGVLGAYLGQCRHDGPVSCDTPDGRSTAFAVLGGMIGAGTGWLVQAIREPKRWTPAQITSR